MQANIPRSQPVAPEVRQLYEQYGSQLRSFLGRQSLVKHKVDDLLHDIFECLLRYPPTGQLIKPDAYLWRIAWRLVNSANRRVQQDGQRMEQVADQVGGWVLGQSSTATPADLAEWVAYQEQVRASLARLPPEVRKALLLARLGYPYKEIAARMDISVDSLRRYLRQGYLTLRTCAAEAEEE